MTGVQTCALPISIAAIAFIGAAAAAGIYVGTKETVIRGDAMAAKMLERVKSKGITKITCDDNTPVTPNGAVFTCQFHGNDGSTARFRYTMNRAGGLAEKLLDSSDATIPRPAPEPGTDSWK